MKQRAAWAFVLIGHMMIGSAIYQWSRAGALLYAGLAAIVIGQHIKEQW